MNPVAQRDYIAGLRASAQQMAGDTPVARVASDYTE
jgi:hypothetical protein